MKKKQRRVAGTILTTSGRTTESRIKLSLVIAGILSQLAFITAILYYFGWATTQAIFSYFGVDANSLGLSTANYVIRSIGVAFTPLTMAAIGGLLALIVHHRVIVPLVLHRSTGKIVGAVLRGSQWAAGILFAATTAGFIAQNSIGRDLGISIPMLLVLGVGITAYSDLLFHRYGTLLGSRVEAPRAARLAKSTILAILFFLGLVWALGLYASESGEATAIVIASGAGSSPAVVLYSSDRLLISGPGVHVSPSLDSSSRYKFAYSGLRLLARSPGNLLLLPTGWRKGQDPVFSVRDDDKIRLDIIGQ